MEINLNDIPIGIAQNEYELKTLKSAKIYKELKSAKSDFNCMIVSVSVFEILEYHDFYQKDFSVDTEDDEFYYVGEFCNLKVYIDIFLHPSQIILSYDREIMRENKLNKILDDTYDFKQNLVINVYN